MNKITFFVLSTSGTPVKQLTVSKTFLWLGVLFMFIGASLCGYWIYDYSNLRKSLSDAIEFEKKVAYQNDEILVYRKQIQKFADEINTLKSNLLVLNGFEKEVRIIAGIDISEKNNNLFGIGGSIPDDLDTKIQLTKRHNSLIREMHDQVEQLDSAIQNQQKGFESLLKKLDEQRNLLAATPAIRPAKGFISSKFGSRKSPFTGMSEFHEGLDIANAKGTPIIAAADGVVTYANEKGGFGKLLIINHGHGLVTRYAHLSECLKKSGDTVKRGDKIGLMGNTGRTTGAHLHYEVHVNGVPVNPEKYILN